MLRNAHQIKSGKLFYWLILDALIEFWISSKIDKRKQNLTALTSVVREFKII